MPVDGVALWPAPDRRPLRDPLLHHAGEVESLPDRDQSGPGRQQVAEHLARGRRPWLRDGRAFAARFCRVVGAMLTLLRAATSAARSTSSGLDDRSPDRAEDRLAVGEEQSVAQRGHPRAPRTDAQGPGPLRLGGPSHVPSSEYAMGRAEVDTSVSSSSASW